MTGTRRALAAECESIWAAALVRLGAFRLVSDALAVDPPQGPFRLLALGKAAPEMAQAALARLGPGAVDGVCVAPAGTVRAVPGVRVLAGSHPRPDGRSAAAGEALLTWAARGRGIPVLALLSGGGSALAVAPAEGVPFEDEVVAVDALMRAGLDIGSLNAVRKHLSRLKGGRLGAMLAPAPVRVLVLSDVPGDDLSAIASGPFAPDPTTFADALAAVERARAGIPRSARAHLEAGARGEREETPKPGDPRLAGIAHRILAGPIDLARTAAEIARERGLRADFDPSPLSGDVADVASRLAAWARANAGRGRRLLALGGEPTIRVQERAAAPDGGRAQHLALLAAVEISGLPAAILAAGSDGRDGPTEQAGAVVDGETASDATASGVDVAGALADARSGPACVALGAAIPRRETGTHLCDLVLAAVE